MDRVAVLYDADDRARRLRGVVDLHHHLMQIRVETLAKRFDPPNAEALKRLHEDAQRRLDSFDECGVFRRRCRLAIGRDDRTLQIVDDDQELARELCDGEFARVLSRLIGSPPWVL